MKNNKWLKDIVGAEEYKRINAIIDNGYPGLCYFKSGECNSEKCGATQRLKYVVAWRTEDECKALQKAYERADEKQIKLKPRYPEPSNNERIIKEHREGIKHLSWAEEWYRNDWKNIKVEKNEPPRYYYSYQWAIKDIYGKRLRYPNNGWSLLDDKSTPKDCVRPNKDWENRNKPIIFDGELVNFQEWKEKLIQDGYVYKHPPVSTEINNLEDETNYVCLKIHNHIAYFENNEIINYPKDIFLYRAFIDGEEVLKCPICNISVESVYIEDEPIKLFTHRQEWHWPSGGEEEIPLTRQEPAYGSDYTDKDFDFDYDETDDSWNETEPDGIETRYAHDINEFPGYRNTEGSPLNDDYINRHFDRFWNCYTNPIFKKHEICNYYSKNVREYLGEIYKYDVKEKGIIKGGIKKSKPMKGKTFSEIATIESLILQIFHSYVKYASADPVRETDFTIPAEARHDRPGKEWWPAFYTTKHWHSRFCADNPERLIVLGNELYGIPTEKYFEKIITGLGRTNFSTAEYLLWNEIKDGPHRWYLTNGGDLRRTVNELLLREILQKYYPKCYQPTSFRIPKNITNLWNQIKVKFKERFEWHGKELVVLPGPERWIKYDGVPDYGLISNVLDFNGRLNSFIESHSGTFEATIMLLYYREMLTDKQIGDKLGLERSKVTRIRNKCLKEMHKQASA